MEYLSLGVDYKHLLTCVRSCTGAEVSWEQGDNKVIFKAGRSRLSLNAVNLSKRMFPDSLESPKDIECLPEFLEGLSVCSVSMGTDYGKPEELGVQVFRNARSSGVYSSTNVLISYCELPEGEDINLALPAAFVSVLLKLSEERAVTRFAYTPSWACCWFDDGVMLMARATVSVGASDMQRACEGIMASDAGESALSSEAVAFIDAAAKLGKVADSQELAVKLEGGEMEIEYVGTNLDMAHSEGYDDTEIDDVECLFRPSLVNKFLGTGMMAQYTPGFVKFTRGAGFTAVSCHA